MSEGAGADGVPELYETLPVMPDYLVQFEIDSWQDGEKITSRTHLRVAGTSRASAISGAKAGLKEIPFVDEVRVLDSWRDHNWEYIDEADINRQPEADSDE